MKALFFLPLLLVACNPTIATNPDSTKPSHQLFDQLLKQYVNEQGLVNYEGFKKERQTLKNYLNTLEKNAPNDKWSKNEQLAYWINAYNAYTLDLVLEYYPIESINDIGSKIQIPFVNTAWDKKFINIGSETYDLNNIEHGIIRKQFDEPRIHFALVCAAMSCPKLKNEAFVSEKLEAQLNEAAKDFLADKAKNNLRKTDEAEISKIFSWYGGDFKKQSSLIAFINQYSTIQLKKDATIRFMDYDWALNEQ